MKKVKRKERNSEGEKGESKRKKEKGENKWKKNERRRKRKEATKDEQGVRFQQLQNISSLSFSHDKKMVSALW